MASSGRSWNRAVRVQERESRSNRPRKPGPVPENLDWALWQGPSPDHEFLINADRKKPGLYVHYDWHYFWEYGNGEIGNQGVHQMDMACWGHNRGLPVKVYSSGGRYGLDDDGQTPNTQPRPSPTRMDRS